MPAVSFPLHASGLNQWADFFPSRHGRVSFGQFEGAEKLSVPAVRLLTSLHFEFAEFHKRIAQPLDDGGEDGFAALQDYSNALLHRLEDAKRHIDDEGELMSISNAAVLTELVGICLVESEVLCAARLPRWLLHHCGLAVEELVMDAQHLLEEEMTETDREEFWTIVTRLALLDLSPVVAQLLSRYVNSSAGRSDRSAELLLAYFEEVPSLFDIAAAARSPEQAMSALEKRRHFASVALFKTDAAVAPAIAFIWKLQIGGEQYAKEIEQAILGDEENEWFVKTALLWTWLHTVDVPSAALQQELGQLVVGSSGISSMSASSLDGAIYAIMAADWVSFFHLLVSKELSGEWFTALMVDLCFYAGGVPDVKIRDGLLLAYTHWLSASACVPTPLGRRLAVDVAQTLSESAAARAAPEIIGKLPHGPERTKAFLKTVVLGASDNFGEAVSMEQFQKCQRDSRVLDALFALSVGAEVAEDVHVGACRISDFVDSYGPQLKEALAAAAEAAGEDVSKHLLPEYIESGRFDFQCAWSRRNLSASEFVKLVTSPNCPPESVVPLVTELRNTLTAAKQQLPQSEAIAVLKVLSDVQTWLVTDCRHADMLAAYIATEALRIDDDSPFVN